MTRFTVLSLILVRGGSRRVLRKNLKTLARWPLVMHTINVEPPLLTD